MIDLPLYPGPQAATPGLVDYGGFLTPPLGGPVQRIDRMGNRFILRVVMPPLDGAEGRVWVSRLIRGKTEGARMDFPLLDFLPGLPGLPLVNGAGQSGRVLNIRSATPSYVFREGQFFSIQTAGRHYFTMVDSETVVSAGGTASLPISPMLRTQHLDGDSLHVARPMIEGYILGSEYRWNMQLGNFQGLEFEIVEAE